MDHETSLSDRYPSRAGAWRLKSGRLELSHRPLLMGVVNVTPDSFSDGGQFFDPASAVDRAMQLENEGADILDIGAESARPQSEPVSTDEELRRVMPVLESLCGQSKLPISIDTSKARVARAAISTGVEIINDITGLEGDPEMVQLAVESSAGVCAMHMQGSPQTMQDAPTYDDVVEDIFGYLSRRRDALLSAGIKPERICLDPGIGFGKTNQHNLTLIASAGRFHALGCPILIGHSRKRFIGKVLGDSNVDRTSGTVGVALALARQGVQIIRVHDVKPVREAMLLFEASGGIDGP